MNDKYRMVAEKDGPWVLYRRGAEWRLAQRPDSPEPGSEWEVVREWPLGSFRPQAQAELKEWLLGKMPADVPPDTAKQLVDAISGLA